MYVTEETITKIAEDRWATARDPRLAQIFSALVRHIHAFAREVPPDRGRSGWRRWRG